MEYYSFNGNKILIGHFPGQTKNVSGDLLNEFSERTFSKPDNVGIVCVITKDHTETAPLINQLHKNGYEYYNSLANRNIVWFPERKIQYVLQSLKLCQEEYALILDGDDTAILCDLDNIIDVFESYNKKIIYNSSIWMYPHIIVDDVENRGQYGEYCYLNAGCAIGKTEDLIEFYEYAWDILRKTPKPVSSEQYYIRKAFNKRQDQVFFDYECKIFQCWHKQQYRYETDKETGEEKCFLI